jgi:hypothetical protein
MLTLDSLILGSIHSILSSRSITHLHPLTLPMPPNVRSLTPSCRPGFSGSLVAAVLTDESSFAERVYAGEVRSH